MHTAAKVSLLIGAASVVGVVGWVGLPESPIRRTGGPQLEKSRDTRSAFADTAVPFDSFEHEQDLAQHLYTTLQHSGNTAGYEHEISQIADQVGDLWFWRMQDLDVPGGYARVRERWGYAPVDTEYLERIRMDVSYEAMFDEPFPGYGDIDAVRRRFFDHALTRDGGAMQLESIAGSPDHAVIQFGTACPVEGIGWPTLEGIPWADSGSGVSFQRWYVPAEGHWPNPRDPNAPACAEAATLAVLCRFGSGDVYALTFMLYRLDGGPGWRLAGLGTAGMSEDATVHGLEY